MKTILIIGVVCILIGGIFCGVAYAAGERYINKNTVDSANSFSASDINKINISEHVAEVKFIKGDNSGEILVQAKNLMESGFKCEVSGGVLKISYNPNTVKFGFISLPTFAFDFGKYHPVINIYIPSDKMFDELYFDGGVGDILIEEISVKSLIIGGGLGNYKIENIYSENIKINGGVGNITILDGTINGDIKIDGGLGNAKLNFRGDIDDYNINVNGGLGDIKINNQRGSSANKSGGKYKITIDGGVGNVDININ